MGPDSSCHSGGDAFPTAFICLTDKLFNSTYVSILLIKIRGGGELPYRRNWDAPRQRFRIKFPRITSVGVASSNVYPLKIITRHIRASFAGLFSTDTKLVLLHFLSYKSCGGIIKLITK